MNAKKSLLIAGAVSTIGLASLGGVAAAQNSTNTSGSSDLVDKLSQTFHLDKTAVQKVFDEDRQAHQAEHMQRLEQQLNQAVTEGKLTTQQKDAILTKLKEVRAEMESQKDTMQDKTPEERRQLMKQKHDELKQWATDNNIPQEYLHFMGGHGGGPRRHMNSGEKPAEDMSADTSAQTDSN